MHRGREIEHCDLEWLMAPGVCLLTTEAVTFTPKCTAQGAQRHNALPRMQVQDAVCNTRWCAGGTRAPIPPDALHASQRA